MWVEKTSTEHGAIIRHKSYDSSMLQKIVAYILAAAVNVGVGLVQMLVSRDPVGLHWTYPAPD